MVLFNKTRTLTEDKPKVAQVMPFEINKKELLSIAAGLASLSNHPLSQAIANYAKEHKVSAEKLKNFEEIGGHGVVADLNGVRVGLGNNKLLIKNKISLSGEVDKKIESFSLEGSTPILIFKGDSVIGLMGLWVQPKPDAKKAVQDLEKISVKVAMITGDNKKVAEVIGKQIGITTILSEVLPADKADEVKRLQKKDLKVAFVGDGINDAPALAQSDLGIAIGTGSDIAIETASIVLMKGSPSKVVSSIKLSQRTFSIIKQNLFWAFIYNIVGLPIAALGLLNPIFASFAMSMSSVSVITNSLRIKRFKG